MILRLDTLTLLLGFALLLLLGAGLLDPAPIAQVLVPLAAVAAALPRR